MKRLLTLVAISCFPMFVFCQDLTGLWKGTLYNDSTQQNAEYEILVTKERGKLIAYSHTSFTIGDKKYFGIKKINVRIAKDGKVVMQDAKLVEENYPGQPEKNVIQLNVLDLNGSGDDAALSGLFVTNRSKDFRALTGKISLKKVNPLTQSELVAYFQKNNNGENILAVK
jgi:hypothetical protein